jgi:hypothetical protein
MSAAKEAPHKRISAWWAVISLATGFAVAFAVGQFESEGGAEIAGVMAATTILCIRAFWDFRVKRWFLPLVAGWALLHAIALIFLILPMQLERSKEYLQLVWVEFFAFVGLIFLASRVWGGLPDDA